MIKCLKYRNESYIFIIKYIISQFGREIVNNFCLMLTLPVMVRAHH